MQDWTQIVLMLLAFDRRLQIVHMENYGNKR